MLTFGLVFTRAILAQRRYGAASAALHANRRLGGERLRLPNWRRAGCLAVCLVASTLGAPTTIAQSPPSLVPQLPALPGEPAEELSAVDSPAGTAAGASAGGEQQWAARSAAMLIGLPTAFSSGRDQLMVEPQIQFGEPTQMLSDEMSLRWLQTTRPSTELSVAPPFFFIQEELPSPAPEGSFPAAEAPMVMEVAPVFETLVAAAPTRGRRLASSTEKGLGYERLAFSLFDIDPAQPFNNLRVRMALGHRMHLPDRAEYFWGRTVDRRGPRQGESVLNYQDMRLRMETGAKKFSAAFEVPFRAVDPVNNPNHAGLGDLQLITKTVLLSGNDWLFTQYFGTHMPTGAVGMGLGTGHVSLEPGLLFRNKWSDDTWLHGELKFWFPLGADPAHGGQVVKFATGVNRVWYETDTSAWLPSLELTTYTVLNGLARDAAGAVQAIDGDLMFYLTPGLHYAYDGRGDMGLFEIGSSLSLVTSRDRFTDSTFTVDLRWSW